MTFPRRLIAVLLTVAISCIGILTTAAPASAATDVIAGKVTQSGSPLPGVSVTLTGGSGGPYSFTTNSTGDYGFINFPPGTYTVTPTLAGRTFSPTSATVVLDGTTDVPDTDFTATTNNASISGSVTDGASPLNGVTITLSGPTPGSSTTASGGTFSFAGRAPGSYTVTPSFPGRTFSPTSRTFTLSGVDVTNNTFTSTVNNATISGTIVGAGSTPIAGVTVNLTGGASTSFVTGGGGTYSFPNLAPGNYTVTPVLADYSFAPAAPTLTLSGTNQVRDFTGTRYGSITGTVYNDVNNNGSYQTSGATREAGAVGVTVYLDLNSDGSPAGEPTAITGASGVYTFPNLLPGTYSVKTVAPAGGTVVPSAGHSVVVAENDDKTAPLTSVRYASSIAGNVVLNGVGVENAYLNIDRDGDGQPEQAISDGNGNYVFASVPPGVVRVTPLEPTAQYSVLPLNRDVTVTANQNTTGVNFTYTKAASAQGYILAAADGGVFTHGAAKFAGSAGGTRLNAPIVSQAIKSDGSGYYFVASDGGVFNYGNTTFRGSMGGQRLNSPIVGMALTPDENGYYLVAADGGVFAFGSAKFRGSMGGQRLNSPIVGITADRDSDGYTLVASDGGIFNFNSAFFGSAGSLKLNSPIVGIAADPDGAGYTLVASDGGVFNYASEFYGSTGSLKLNKPIVGISVAPDGEGYYMVASDGGIFSFPGSGTFDPLDYYGSEGGTRLNQPIVGMSSF